MAKILWIGRLSADGRFRIQREHVLHEPVYYELMLSPEDEKTARDADIETGFFGLGALSRCKTAAQQIADAGNGTS